MSDSPSIIKNLKVKICAICRNGLDERCIECDVLCVQKTPCQHPTHSDCKGHFVNPITKQECTIVGNACCSHMYHYNCIDRWLKKRQCCPLCNLPWILSRGLSLQERAAASWMSQPLKILEYALGDVELDQKVNNILIQHQPMYLRGIDISEDKKKIIARLFSDSLDVSYLEKLLATKKAGIK
uniref:RING-H2 zinc finger domain protein n=1 Tax=Pithovirus LCPAC101 TaxID=2506586 RepID=A0A481Z5G5_9VIRU|nr:MAG: RING-H2 zinc finger domain protein [Pithovirus LCPAC101]